MVKKQGSPKLVAFEVTRRCALNCKHCRAANYPDEKELTTNQCKNILLALAQYRKCVTILTGGEPTFRPDLAELVSFGRSQGLRMVMASCGYRVSEETLRILKDAGLMAISLSLDASDAETHDEFRGVKGAFDSAIRTAELAKKAGLRFQINTTITSQNYNHLESVADLAFSLGAYCFNPFILVPTGRGEDIRHLVLNSERYEYILKKLAGLKKSSPIEVRVTCGPQFSRVCHQMGLAEITSRTSGCMAGDGFGFISASGDVQPCGFLRLPAGNLIRNNYDFAQIWEHSELLNEIRDRNCFEGKCHRCEYVDICGGCRARAYASTGDYLASDPICSYIPGGGK